jgi:Kef-type K+ transport system membrane component KefB
MSAGTAERRRSAAARGAQLLALLVVFGLLLVASRVTPTFQGTFGVIAAVGLLLLAGMLASDLLEVIGLPHLTGYLLAGIVAGPHVLHFIDHETVESLQGINTLALSLIALAGGAELRIDLLKSCLRSLGWHTLVQSSFGFVVMSCAFAAASSFLPFVRGFDLGALLGISLLWGVISVCRSPSATLGILAQLRPDGPVSRFALAFIMSSDVVVIIMLTLALALVRPLIEPSAGISLHDLFALGHEILGSFSLGTSLGLLLAVYLRLVGRQLLIPLVALGFGLTEGLRYLRFEPLLTFLVAGFVVENLTKQGPKLLHAVEQAGSVVYVIFFATAGAHLDIPLLFQLWPIALFLTGVRGVAVWIAHRVGSRLADDEPVLRRWGWAPLVLQAGLTIGMSVIVARSYPSFGVDFRSLVVATVAINELVGPVLFKLALDRAGESGRGSAKPSMHPPSMQPPSMQPRIPAERAPGSA